MKEDSLNQLGPIPTGSNPLVQRDLATDILEITEKEKYYSYFVFENEDPQTHHLTHVYFGNHQDKEVAEIVGILDDFFREHPQTPFDVDFDTVEMFGEDEDVRVLRPGTPKSDSPLFLPDLKRELYPYDKSEFKDSEYKPHVTSDLEKFSGKVIGYCLARHGYETVKMYYFGGKQ